MMTRKQFIQRVQWVGHFDSENLAEKAIHTVMEMLARRLCHFSAAFPTWFSGPFPRCSILSWVF